jgi:hypothetical protein
MATIEEAVRQMLVNNAGTLNSTRISYGYRPQNTDLPAVTFTLSGNSAETLGGSPLKSCELTINGHAELAIDAADMVAKIRAACVPGTYDGIVISAIVITSTQLLDPITGISDEQEPSTATVNATAFYEE